jgi:ribonucleoside-diphosphate reductase alpha chain
MDAFGTAVSMSLQYGVPLEDYVRKFSHMRFEPQGYTKNPDIRIAKSLIDYIFRWLGITFLPGYKEASLGVLPPAEASDEPGVQGSGFGVQDKTIKPRPVVAGKAPLADKPGTTKAEGGRRKGEGGETATLPHPTRDTRHPTPHATNGHTNGNGQSNGTASAGDISAALLARAGVLLKDAGPTTARSEQFADFQSDAPACDNCGAITVRSGNCYLCHNCGSSMGCS